MEPPLNCPICGTPFKITPHALRSVTSITMITVECVRCKVSRDYGVDKYEMNRDEALAYPQENLSYFLENQQDAQAKRLAAQLADLERVRDSLAKRLITTVRQMPHWSYKFSNNPEWFACRGCGMVAETAEQIQHLDDTRMSGPRWRCPLGAVNIASDYLLSIQDGVTKGQGYDVGHFINWLG